MKNFLYISLICLVSMMISSCGNDLSDLNQITANELTCDVNQDRADYYYEKYGKNNYRISASESVKKRAFQKLSNVPEQYLEFVIGKYNISMELGEGQYGGGVTYLAIYGNNKMYPTSLYSDLAVLAHEFGHASEGYHWDKYGSSFVSDLSKISSIVASKYYNQMSWYLRLYAYGSDSSSRDRETFAELFDTWYCSQAARNLLKKGMPEVYEFAQKYLGSSDQKKDVNIFLVGRSIYFSNNGDFSNISYCISSSNEECSEKHSVSRFTNKTGNSNLFVGDDSLSLDGRSSFYLSIYGDDSLVRKVLISR